MSGTAPGLCVGNSSWSVEIDTLNCASPSFGNLSLSSSDSLRELSLLVDKEKPAYSGDIDITVTVLLNNQNRTVTSNVTELTMVLDDVLNIVNRLFDIEVIDVLNQTESVAPVTEDIIRLLDQHAINILSQNHSMRYTNLSNIHFETMCLGRSDNPITLKADNLPFETEAGLQLVEITVPVDQLNSSGVGLNFFVIRNVASILSRYSDQISFGSFGIPRLYFGSWEVVSPLVSIHVLKDGTKVTTFNDEAVRIQLPFRIILPNGSYRKLSCEFLPLEVEDNYSTWQDSGVDDSLTSNSLVNCSSNHLTSFAVLAAVNGLERQSPALTIVSYVGVGVSIVSLALSIFIYLVFGLKLLKNVQHFAYFNLILSLLLLFILFSVGLELPYRDNFGDYIPCKVASGVLQYLVLCVFAWMLIIGVIILILMVWPFYTFTIKFALISELLCWTVPAVYVGSYTYWLHHSFQTPTNSLLSSNTTRQFPGYCWIQSHDVFMNAHRHNLAVIVPICCVILINIAIFIIVIVRA